MRNGEGNFIISIDNFRIVFLSNLVNEYFRWEVPLNNHHTRVPNNVNPSAGHESIISNNADVSSIKHKNIIYDNYLNGQYLKSEQFFLLSFVSRYLHLVHIYGSTMNK